MPTHDNRPTDPRFADRTDAPHYAAVLHRIDELAGCTEGSPEEAELVALSAIAEAFEDAIGWTP
jgi:hypothetical protein